MAKLRRPLTGSKLENAIVRFEEGNQKGVVDAAKELGLHKLGPIGEGIASILGGLSSKRFLERLEEMFAIISDQIENLDAKKLDRPYYKGVEFDILFRLAVEHLRTTRDKEHIRMLATGLVNSGRVEFASEERKEEYFRALRDLTPAHIRALKELMPRPEYPHHLPESKSPQGDEAIIYSNLAARGLVREWLQGEENMPNLPTISANTSVREIQRFLKDFRTAPIRVYHISKFGEGFLRFLTEQAK